jgi:pimeloyl-ACP methyl ester carboxylesterase
VYAAFKPVLAVVAVVAGAALVATAALLAYDATSQAAPLPVNQRPTVVLVHGAWADTSSWDGEVAALRDDGYDVRAISNPLQGLTSDAASVASFLRSIEGPIVLVGHSYGGAVITEAAAGIPNVEALVYVDAAAPDVGETNGSLSGADSVLEQRPRAELFDEVPGPAGATSLYLNRDVFVDDFANDLPRDQALRLWATQRTAATAAFDTPAVKAAWHTIPSWYFISSGDRIITPASERAMAERAHSHVTEFSGGSHLSLISQPEAVTAVIESAATSLEPSR